MNVLDVETQVELSESVRRKSRHEMDTQTESPNVTPRELKDRQHQDDVKRRPSSDDDDDDDVAKRKHHHRSKTDKRHHHKHDHDTQSPSRKNFAMTNN